MATTTYKGLELIATGTENNTWGATLNSSVFNRIDQNLGGIVTKSLTNVNVTLTADESRQAIVRLSGTLTGNVTITTSCQGFFFVENLCTLGAFAVTITNGVAGVTAPAGRSTMIAGTANGVRVASTATFPTGTSMPFQQTAAPTGWTKSTTHDNKALRVVSGTASSGGSTAFTSVFAARTLTRANLPNDTVAVTIVDPGHTHTYERNPSGGVIPSSGSSYDNAATGTTSSSTTGITASFALNGGTTQTSIDFAVQYVDLIIAVKD